MANARKASLGVIFITVFIDLLGFGIVLPLLPRYGDYYIGDADPTERGLLLGLLMSSFSAMQFVFAPIWGRISDRVGRRPILMVGLTGSVLFYGLFGAATGLIDPGETWLGLGPLGWLFVARIGAGIAGATISTAQAYIADVTGTTERAKGMALIGAAFGIGFTFGPLMGAAFVSSDVGAPPSAMPGIAASVLSLVALLCAEFFLPESLRADSQPAKSRWLDLAGLSRAFSQRTVGMILLTIFLTTFAFAQLETTLALLTKYLGLADRYNFFVFAYIGFVLMIAQGFIVRRLVPKIGEFRMSLAGTVLMALGILLVGISARQESNIMLYVVLPISVVGFSALTPSLQAMLSLNTPSTEQGRMLGVGQSMSALARIIGPVVGMVLYEQRVTLPFWGGAGLMTLGILFVVTLRTAGSRRDWVAGVEPPGSP